MQTGCTLISPPLIRQREQIRHGRLHLLQLPNLLPLLQLLQCDPISSTAITQEMPIRHLRQGRRAAISVPPQIAVITEHEHVPVIRGSTHNALRTLLNTLQQPVNRVIHIRQMAMTKLTGLLLELRPRLVLQDHHTLPAD
jgi:hypothetical protein